MNGTIPTVGGELRIRTEGNTCELQTWSTYPNGHAMMSGGLRLAIHTLRHALHVVERAE
jgi:hypothetical protein